MIRASIERETAFPEEITLRSAVEWHKRLSRIVSQATAEERHYIDARWVALVQILADGHSVPLGWLSWALGSLAESELRLVETAAAEGAQALGASG